MMNSRYNWFGATDTPDRLYSLGNQASSSALHCSADPLPLVPQLGCVDVRFSIDGSLPYQTVIQSYNQVGS